MSVRNPEREEKINKAGKDISELIGKWLNEWSLTPIEVLGLFDMGKQGIHKWIADKSKAMPINEKEDSERRER